MNRIGADSRSTPSARRASLRRWSRSCLAINLLNVSLLAASAGLAILFVLRQKRTANPFIPPELFRSRAYRTGLAAGFLNASVNFGVLLLTPILLGEVFRLDAGRIGLLMFPGAAASSLAGLYGGRMIDRKGASVVLLAAAALTGSGLLFLSSLAGRAAWGIASALAFTCSGYILAQPALAKAVSVTLAEGRTGIGMGVYSLSNFMSTALAGIAVTKALEAGGGVAFNPLARTAFRRSTATSSSPCSPPPSSRCCSSSCFRSGRSAVRTA